MKSTVLGSQKLSKTVHSRFAGASDSEPGGHNGPRERLLCLLLLQLKPYRIKIFVQPRAFSAASILVHDDRKRPENQSASVSFVATASGGDLRRLDIEDSLGTHDRD